MSKPVTYYVQTSAIDELTAKFGHRLQYLSKAHKTFLLKCTIHQLSDGTPMSDLINELDPDARIPRRLCDAIVTLDGLSSYDALNLIEAIAAQLRSELMEANLAQRRSEGK